MKYIVLIPAYKPDEKLVDFAKALKAENIDALIVDDGSGEECARYFEECEALGYKVVHHPVNRGKGAALRTGFSELKDNHGDAECIITADSDGQHDIDAIRTVAEACEKAPDALVLGGRFRDDEDIPAKSRFGNTFTRAVFKLATGLSVHDTQTGLRGVPVSAIPNMLETKGDRYEYEMNMLLNLKTWNMPFVEVPIKTIYFDNNSGSHFHPIRDSFLIMRQILKFISASLISFVVDWLLYILFLHVIFRLIFGKGAGELPSWTVPLSYFGARIISGVVNYLLNSRFVFKSAGKRQFIGYFVLWAVILGLGMLGSFLIKDLLGWPGIVCKLLVDLPLFLLSYFVQREVIFKNRGKASGTGKKGGS